MRDRLSEAHGVILCFPVYNFNMNATLKAVIEHCGPAMAGKVVGLMATAGGALRVHEACCRWCRA